jgi:hypothetical protein
MADIFLVPPVPIQLDRPRLLRFDRAAVKRCERELEATWGRDMTFYSALQDLALLLTEGNLGRLRFSVIAILLHGGLVQEDPALTLAQVEEALPYNDPAGLLPYVNSIMEAWFVASPRPEASAGAANEVPAAADPLDGSTGVPSGPMSVSALA